MKVAGVPQGLGEFLILLIRVTGQVVREKFRGLLSRIASQMHAVDLPQYVPASNMRAPDVLRTSLYS